MMPTARWNPTATSYQGLRGGTVHRREPKPPNTPIGAPVLRATATAGLYPVAVTAVRGGRTRRLVALAGIVASKEGFRAERA